MKLTDIFALVFMIIALVAVYVAIPEIASQLYDGIVSIKNGLKTP